VSRSRSCASNSDDLYAAGPAWAALLAGITRDAGAGELIEVHTPAMYDETVRRLREAGRDDVTVVLRLAGGRAAAQ
jgi:hypothetical protein